MTGGTTLHKSQTPERGFTRLRKTHNFKLQPCQQTSNTFVSALTNRLWWTRGYQSLLVWFGGWSVLPAFLHCSVGSPVVTRSTAAGRGMCWQAGDVHLRGAFGKDSGLACEVLSLALGRRSRSRHILQGFVLSLHGTLGRRSIFYLHLCGAYVIFIK